QLRALSAKQNSGNRDERRAAARDLLELVDRLNLRSGTDESRALRAALPKDLDEAASRVGPTRKERLNQFAENGIPWLPSVQRGLWLGGVETLLPGAVSAATLLDGGRVGLATAVMAGAVIAWPVRAVVERFVQAADEKAKDAHSAYRRAMEDTRRSGVRARSFVDPIVSVYRQQLSSLYELAGRAPRRPVPPRATLEPPEVGQPRLIAPWWTFPLRSAVPVAALTTPLAFVISPIAVGAAVGLATVVVGGVQYGFQHLRTRYDGVRHQHDNPTRSYRMLVSDARRAADIAERQTTLNGELWSLGLPALTQRPDWSLEQPPDPVERRAVPNRLWFTGREVVVGALAFVRRLSDAYVQQQLAVTSPLLLASGLQFLAIGTVYGLSEASLVRGNRDAYDRHMHNWYELARRSVRKEFDELTDSVFTQFDSVSRSLRGWRALEGIPSWPRPAATEPEIPPHKPWSPVLHPTRDSVIGRRWYLLRSAAVAATGVGVAALAMQRYHLEPLWFRLSLSAAAVQPVYFYTKYLRKRMDNEGQLGDQEHRIEASSARELEHTKAATAYVRHHVGRLEDLAGGKSPRQRNLPTGTPLADFINLAYRDLDDHLAGNVPNSYEQCAELLSLLGPSGEGRSTDLTTLERQRRELVHQVRRDGDIRPLVRNLVTISATLDSYADALHKHGFDPHVRLSGPNGLPASDSVLHHDPLNARVLAAQTLDPDRAVEQAALIVAKVEQLTGGRYGSLSAADVEPLARPGHPLTEIAVDLVAQLERRSSRGNSGLKILRARRDFRRALTTEYAKTAPARLTWQGRSSRA
ncbi:hypothetical protein, partial [Kribbella sp.]|uniref:hypothetical protein n=1 Tax=Kribbella sp. TaxID=1871183 RepID=UPI002D6A88DD